MSVLVVGAAVSGVAAVRLLERLGEDDVIVYDADADAAERLAGRRHRWGGGDWDAALLEGVHLVVASPGVPPHARVLRDAVDAGVAVWSEIEFAWRHLDTPIVAVTGTNGKTTVTEIAAAMLSASGLRSAPVGNIGDPLCDAVGAGHEVLAVEVAALHLHFVDRFRPEAAVVTNVAPDHLDWFGSYDAYREAKARIHANQQPGDLLAFDADDEGARDAVAGAVSRRAPASGTRLPEGGAGVRDGVLHVGEVRVPTPGLVRDDPVFLVDAALAGVAALHVGATPEGVEKALVDFRPSAHRRELIAEGGGVRWVNDSKATNPHAALASIASWPSVILIAGGRNKDLDVAAVGRAPGVRHVIGIGEAGPEIVDAAVSGEMADDLAEAVRRAASIARSGDTVLLAPACASFDMFRSFGHRGDEFRRLVGEVT